MNDKKNFDPINDTSLKISYPQVNLDKGSVWMWYPGQRTSHLHKKKILESLSRFRNVGYPGSFRQPIYNSFFRKKLNLRSRQNLSWYTLDGRSRMNINGDELDITRKSVSLPPGKHFISISLDFCSTLPALMIHLEDDIEENNWEVSLDRENWEKVEYINECRDPEESPLSSNFSNTHIIIPPQKISLKYNCISSGENIIIQEGGILLIDFFYYEMGQVEFEAEGTGTLEVIVGQSEDEVLQDTEVLEQNQQAPIHFSGGQKKINTPSQALRYACLRSQGTIKVNKIRFNACVTYVTYRGELDCTDSSLSDLWSISCATVHSCMHDFFLDAIYRDALPWALDGSIAMFAANTVFRTPLIFRQQIASQLLPENASKEDLGVLYLDFQLHALIGLHFELIASGDWEYILKYKKTIDRTCDIYLSLCDEKYFINTNNTKKMHFFPDWAAEGEHGPALEGSPSYAQMLFLKVLCFAQEVAEHASDVSRASMYKETKTILQKNIVDFFWDENQHLFINGFYPDGIKDTRISIYSQMFAVLTDIFPSRFKDVAVKAITSGLYRPQNLSISFPWQMLALAQLGASKEIFNFLKKFLFPLIDAGHARIPEDITRGKLLGSLILWYSI